MASTASSVCIFSMDIKTHTHAHTHIHQNFLLAVIGFGHDTLIAQFLGYRIGILFGICIDDSCRVGVVDVATGVLGPDFIDQIGLIGRGP
jgi:hypothetical protein